MKIRKKYTIELLSTQRNRPYCVLFCVKYNGVPPEAR